MLHIPAWKRIGLKLKRPAEQQSTNDNVKTDHVSKKPKLNGHSNSSEAFKDLRKTNGDSPHLSHKLSRKVSHKNGNASDSQLLETAPSLKKRKSVTFSPDAKAKDGPLRDLDYSQVNGQEDDAATSPSKKAKKKKNSSKQAVSSVDEPSAAYSDVAGETKSAGSPSKPYLLYLDEYFNRKDRWRFNKNRQTQILQNIFNTYRIPESYNPMLQSYLSGLQGESRTRLREEAQRILAQIDSNDPVTTKGMSNSVEGGAPESQVTQGVNVLKRERAQVVLGVLEQDDPPTTKQQSTEAIPKTTEQKPPAKRSRGRKRRTEIALPHDIDTSSDSSSDEDTSSNSASSDSIASSDSSNSDSSISDSSSESSEDSDSEDDDDGDAE